ncbi:MAG: arginine repressor [Firmicutes bacterium]|mgnify:CR=1 FL=1|nr:arginine repressor [Bacillota bacterium]
MRYSRQNKILEIIAANEVETQDRLQELLQEAGYNVTQATISRDIKELQLVKGLSKTGKYKYVAGNYQERPISDRFIKIFRECTLSWAAAQNLIVVKTLPGCGNASAEAIDCLELPHIVGTISGDNTMLIVVDHEDNVKQITDEFDKMINKKED